MAINNETDHKSYDHHKARREALLYCLINHFDKFEKRDGIAPNADDMHKSLSSAAKRRYRNMAYRNAVNAVNKHNANLKLGETEWSVNDPEVIVNAFFDTPLGAQFKSKREDWVSMKNPALQNYMQKIDAWTIGNLTSSGKKTSVRTVLSPYDPDFAMTDGFRDRLGYLFAPKGVSEDAVNFDLNNIDSAYFVPPIDANGGAGLIAKPDRYDVSNMPLTKLTSDALRQSGYMELANYVIGDKAKASLAQSLGISASNNNKIKHSPVVMSEDQRRYMKEACAYMSNLGYEYDIIADDKIANENNEPVAYLDRIILKTRTDGISITLYDKDDKQGQIYKNGLSTYISTDDVASGHKKGGFLNTDVYKIEPISCDDRMAMLKWYFGERVRVLNPLKGVSQYYVGQNATISFANSDSLSPDNFGLTNTATAYNTTKYSDKRSDNHSFLLGFKNVSKLSDAGFKSSKAIHIISKPSYASAISENGNLKFVDDLFISDSTYTRTDRAIVATKFGRIPSNKILPMDAIETVDDQGNAVRSFDINRGKEYNDELKSSGRLSYYRDTVFHSELTKWVERAKTNHAEAMNLDKIIDLYSQPNLDVEAIDEWLSSDAGDADLREVKNICQGILSGEITHLTADDESIKNSMDIGSSLGDRIKGVQKYYADYVNMTFGSVPDLAEPTLDNNGNIISRNGFVKPDGEEIGFVPNNVVKYTRGDIDYGDQNTSTLLTHMVYRLGEHYDTNDLVKGDSYAARLMKNRTISFNSELELCDESFSSHFSKIKVDTDEEAIASINSHLQEGLAHKGMKVHDMSVTADMMWHTMKSMHINGCSAESIRLKIDSNGVMRLSGEVNRNRSNKTDMKLIERDLGQIFEPDEYGAIHMNTFVPSGKIYIPGHTGRILPKDISNPTPINERLRVYSWQHSMKRAISQQVRETILTLDGENSLDPKGAALNSVITKGPNNSMSEDDYAARLPKDPNHMTEEEELFVAVLKTEGLEVHLDKVWSEMSTTNTQASLDHPYDDIASVQDYTYSDQVDNINLRLHPVEFDGIVDPRHVSGGKNQGTNLHLVEHVVINDDGTVEPSPVENDMSPILKTKAFMHADHDTVDRVLGASGNTCSALAFDYNTHVAMMTCGGGTYEDGIIVSKKYAEQNSIRGVDGNYRPLIMQDKGSDFHFNKGVISYIVDPDLHSDKIRSNMKLSPWMKDADINDASLTGIDIDCYDKHYHIDFDKESKESREDQIVHGIQKANDVEGLDDLMKIFGDNPDLDVIVSPYSTMSRFNAGTLKDMMMEPKDLVVNGETIKGGMGRMPFMIHDMRADVKSHIYNSDTVQSDKGRKASSQFAWALQARGATALIKDFFGSNDKSVHNFREYCIAVGLDIDQDGKPRIGYSDQGDKKRYLFKLPDVSEFDDNTIAFKHKTALKDKRNKSAGVVDLPYSAYYDMRSSDTEANLADYMFRLSKFTDAVGIEKQFITMLDESGGFMELPFQLRFATADRLGRDNSKLKGAFDLMPTGQTYTDIIGNKKNTFALPVVSHNLRSGLDLADGTSKAHNYTNKYISIYNDALKYMLFERELSSEKASTDSKYRRVIESCMRKCITDAQSNFDTVTNSIIERKFDNKDGAVRGEIMNNTVRNSGTVVWSADPRLDIDQIGMSAANAKKMGLSENDMVLLGRDPYTKDDLLRAYRVKISKSPAEESYNQTVESMKDAASKSNDAFDVDKCEVVSFSFEEQATYPPMTNERLRKILTNCPDFAKELGTGNYIPVVHKGISIERVNEAGESSIVTMNSDEYATRLIDHPDEFVKCKVFDRYTIGDHEVTTLRGSHDKNGRFVRNKATPTENEWIAVENHELQGITVHPTVAKSHNGDFDGDAVALFVPSTYTGKTEMREVFSTEHNLLNRGVTKSVSTEEYPGLIAGEGKDTVSIHPLYILPDLDTATGIYHNPELGEKYKQLTIMANNLQVIKADFEKRKAEASDSTAVDKTVAMVDGELRWNLPAGAEIKGKDVKYGSRAIEAALKQCSDDLNTWVHDAVCKPAADILRFDSFESLAKSEQDIIDHKAKGDIKKLRYLFNNLGVDFEVGKDEKIDLKSLKLITDPVTGENCTRAQADGVVFETTNASRDVTALKADDTALGGTSAQKGAMAFRDTDAFALEMFMTEPVTQSILQSKHDPEDAKSKDYIVRCWGKDALNGYKLTGSFAGSCDDIRTSIHEKIQIPVVDKDGNTVVDSNGNALYTYQKCTREEWIAQVTAMYSALKVDVPPEAIEAVADIMTTQEPVTVKSTTNFDVPDSAMHKGCVLGFEDYADKHAALIDRMAYKGNKFGEFLKEACKPESQRESIFGDAAVTARKVGIREKVNVSVANESAPSTPDNNADDNSSKKSKAKSYNRAVKTAYSEMSNSATFAPASFVRGHVTGKPLVLGIKDTFIDKTAAPKARISYFGETQADFNTRMKANFSVEQLNEFKNKANVDKSANNDNGFSSTGVTVPSTPAVQVENNNLAFNGS